MYPISEHQNKTLPYGLIVHRRQSESGSRFEKIAILLFLVMAIEIVRYAVWWVQS